MAEMREHLLFHASRCVLCGDRFTVGRWRTTMVWHAKKHERRGEAYVRPGHAIDSVETRYGISVPTLSERGPKDG